MENGSAQRFPEYRTFALWRLMAATLVMSYHFSFSAPHMSALTAWFEHMNPLLDMFFVLSGFLIYERYRYRVSTRADYAFFILRRVSRLYPLHLITLGFFVVVGLAAHAGLINSGGLHDRYDFGQLWMNLLLLQAWGVHDVLTFNYVSWSLSGEWFAYLLLPVLAFAGLRFGLPGLIIVLVLTIGGLEWADRGAVTYADTWYDAKSWGAYRIFADFTFGAILFCIAERMPSHIGSRAAGWLFLAVSIATMFADMGTYVALALIGCAVVCVTVAERERPDSSAMLVALTPVTALSYGIYMWHPVAETVFISGVWRLLLDNPAGNFYYVFVPIPMIATFAVAALSLRFFETPAANAIMKLGERGGIRRKAAAASI